MYFLIIKGTIMPVWILSAAKGILIHLATKYAAELLFDRFTKVLSEAAAKTETDLDDVIVSKIANERDVILEIIKKA
jgi:hypothetical protein